MAETNNDKDNKEKTVEVPLKLLEDMQRQMADIEKKNADMEARNAGLEELFAKGADAQGEQKLRTKKNFEPKFRTVRLHRFPIAGDIENLGYVVGWGKRGAYQEVDRSGVSPQIVDYIDIIFLDSEKTKEGKIKAEKVKLLDFINSPQVHCKIVDTKRKENVVETGEEIDVSVFDPAHGLVSTGEKIDGYYTESEIQYQIEIPGRKDPLWINGDFVN